MARSRFTNAKTLRGLEPFWKLRYLKWRAAVAENIFPNKLLKNKNKKIIYLSFKIQILKKIIYNYNIKYIYKLNL